MNHSISIGVINPLPAIVKGNTPVLPIVPIAPIGIGGGSGVPAISIEPIQVVGLIPLFPCDIKECREICDDGWKNPVFGELVGNSYQTQMTYENDWSTFLIDVSLYNANPNSTSVTFELEKLINGIWMPAPLGINLNSNSFGTLFPLGSISGHPTYAGYAINWGSILFHKGEGCYRFKAKTNFQTSTTTGGIVGGVQATCTFDLAGTACTAGAILGTLKTTSGNIPATYSINQPNPSFTIAQNVAYIVNLINTGTYPYTATQSGDSFTITGQSYSANNYINFNLLIYQVEGICKYEEDERLLGGIDGAEITTPVIISSCFVSPPFDLKKWDCFRATGTVKFETWLTGTIGDPYKDYLKHNICGIQWYDSLRTYGFFGYQKSPEYKTENLEWGSPQQGKIEHVRDEQIQRWEYLSDYLPEYLHTRFSTFAMMCDKTFASDYNLNNSDYTLKRKNVIKDSGYEPEYIDKEAHFQKRNKQKVQVFFKRGVQSVEKSICCPT